MVRIIGDPMQEFPKVPCQPTYTVLCHRRCSCEGQATRAHYRSAIDVQVRQHPHIAEISAAFAVERFAGQNSFQFHHQRGVRPFPRDDLD